MNECPLKRDHFEIKIVLQPSFFGGHVSFQGSKCTKGFFWDDSNLFYKAICSLDLRGPCRSRSFEEVLFVTVRSVNELWKRHYFRGYLIR